MAQPVWVLSVDLQTKTATFTSGLADAAKGAKGAFNDIKKDAQAMGADTSYSMMEARHSVMLLGEEFGIHLPRALTSFIASLGPIGGALEAAFPFLAIAVGATLLIEHLVKMREEAEKAANAQVVFGTTVDKTLGGLDDKLLRTGIQMDDLTGNHLAALQKELVLIDHATLADLMSTFDIFAKGADAALAELKTSWYQFSAGSAGAKHSLDEFKRTYDSLLAKKDEAGALALLDGKVSREREILRLQEQARSSANQADTGTGEGGDYSKFEEAKLALQKMGAGYSEKEVEAQKIIVDVLNAQVITNQKNADLKKLQSQYTEAKTDKTMGREADADDRREAEGAKWMADELQKIADQNYKEAISALQANERQKIDATRAASAERLAAIDAAIKEENAKGLQATGYYKALLVEKVNVTRQMGEEKARVEAEIGKEIAESGRHMADLQIAAEKEFYDHRAAMKHVSDNQRLTENLQIANEEYAAQMEAYNRQIQALDKFGKDYELKLKQLQDKELELTRAHENQITQIEDKAQQERQAKQEAAFNQMRSITASGLTSVLMGHQSFARMISSIGDQVVSGMIQNAIKSMLVEDMDKERQAAHAARYGYLAGMKFPWPVNLVMAPALGAAAFASVMAFNSGGIVPGTGNNDTVPIMATPGEGIMPKRLTEGLTRAANGDGFSGKGDTHVHYHATNHIQAFDSSGVDAVLRQHSEKFAEHIGHELRRRNM